MLERTVNVPREYAEAYRDELKKDFPGIECLISYEHIVSWETLKEIVTHESHPI
jgi:hypothetical protein